MCVWVSCEAELSRPDLAQFKLAIQTVMILRNAVRAASGAKAAQGSPFSFRIFCKEGSGNLRSSLSLGSAQSFRFAHVTPKVRCIIQREDAAGTHVCTSREPSNDDLSDWKPMAAARGCR